jgi:hypothetical protein
LIRWDTHAKIRVRGVRHLHVLVVTDQVDLVVRNAKVTRHLIVPRDVDATKDEEGE